MSKPRREDLTGQKFERLKVIEFDHVSDDGQAYYKCECECGTQKIIAAHNLRSGKTRSCGCLQKEATRKANKINKQKALKTFNVGQASEIKLKKKYKKQGNRRSGKVKQYKLSPTELKEYLKELETKEVKYVGNRG